MMAMGNSEGGWATLLPRARCHTTNRQVTQQEDRSEDYVIFPNNLAYY